MADRTVSVKLIADAQAYIRGVEEAARKTREATQSIEQRLAAQRDAMETVGRSALIVGGAIATGLGLSAKAAIDWEAAWAGVLKTVDGTPVQLARVEDGLRDLTGVLPASHQEIAAVAEAAGQLGVQTDNVVDFTRVMVDLGETTNLTSEEAATSLARFMNVMQTSQDDVDRLGASLVELGNNYATTEGEILAMAQRLAGSAQVIGFTEGEVFGLATALSSVGIEAEAGGSAISKVMIDIAASVDEGGDRLELFAEVAGVSAQQFADQWRSDPGAALAMFVQGLADAESQGRSMFEVLNTLGLTEIRMRTALLNSAAAADQFSEAMATGNRAFEENTALVDEAEKRYETLEAKLGIMRNQIVDAAIVLGEQLMPAIEFVVEGITGFANGLSNLDGPAAAVEAWIGLIAAGILLAGGAALTAVPKIAAFKVSLETLGITGPKVVAGLRGVSRMLGGPWGMAFIAAIGVLAAFDRAQMDVTGNAEKLTNTLSSGGGAATWETFAQGLAEDFRIAADEVSELYSRTHLLTGNSHAIEQLAAHAEELGTALAGMPADEAASAFRDFVEAGELTDEQIYGLIVSSESLTARMYELANAAGVNLDTLEQSEKQAWAAAAMTGELDLNYESLAGSMDESTEAAARVQAAVDEVTGSMDGQTTSIEESIAALRDLNSEYIAMDNATVAFYQSVADINEALGDGMPQAANDAKDGLDLTTEAGWDVQAMLANLAEDTKNYAAEILELTGNTEDATAGMQEGYDAFVLAAQGAGLTEEAARALAEQYGLIPDAVVTIVTAEVENAERVISTFMNKRRVVTIQVNAGPTPDIIARNGVATGYVGGGRLSGPFTGADDRLGFDAHGNVFGLAGTEWIINPWSSQRYDRILEEINRGTYPGYADGGRLAAPVQSSSYLSSSHVNNVTVHMTVEAMAGMDANAVASLASNRAVAKIAESLRGY